MTKLTGKYLLDIRLSRFILLCAMLFPHLLLIGARLNKIPALLPFPQKVVWNGFQYKLPTNANWLVQRISTKLPGIEMNEEEAYSLVISKDSAVLTAITPKGIFRGLQTVRQLTFDENGEKYVAGCSITDWPAFTIRGFMQDVGRNFMPISLLKEQIDVMAAYKFNLFHFHVTDNPGWRLESKIYPQLGSAASMSRWPGKFYTQEEFQDLVQYCSDRYITLVPEFDIPGHCEAFRKAFSLDSMSDPRVQPILLDLIDELCSLVSPEKMPWLHLGTDEVWQKHEKSAPGLLSALIERAKANGRKVVVWRPGQQTANDSSTITQLWSSGGTPRKGHPYLDSRLNYLNHLDPLAGIAQLYFDRICGKAHGDSLALGGILCCWNDNNVTKASDILAQNPVYPGMLTYSESSWKGQPANIGDSFLARIPEKTTPLYCEFQAFENRLISHRDLYFEGKPFPYVKQSDIEWCMIGPFINQGDSGEVNPVEKSSEKNYVVEGKNFSWTGPYFGGTIHIKHFFGYPSYFSDTKGTYYAATNIWSPVNQDVGCWIGFHDWSRSAGRRGGPFPVQGQWHITNPRVWLNGEVISPPVWNNPGLGSKTDEIPFSDENYFFRTPTKISLKKGWNKVLLKVPQNGKSWKWMFSFVPVRSENGRIREVAGLRYSTNLQLNSGIFKLAPVFGEHMVFQQKKPIEIFGTAAFGDQIRIELGQLSGSCSADLEGKWKLILPNHPVGGPYGMKIYVNGKIVVDWNDILVGEVWFCSGQSNMGFRLDQSQNGLEESEKVLDGNLRLMNFHGIAETSDTNWDSTTLRKVNQLQYFKGTWEKCSPKEAGSFSAIAYHFGKELRERLHVPVGLIQVAVGGAPAEAFIDRYTLEHHPQLVNVMYNWSCNDFIMEWCRQRAMVNISSGNNPLQRHPYMPAYIFEAGISAFQGFPIKGVLWYQGESNAHNVEHHEVVFPELIRSWRQFWKNDQLPFVFAQLSSIQRPGWELFRDSQRRMAGTISNCYMAVTSDLGDSLNVHPVRKKEVGHRMALQALQKVYGQAVNADGPMPLKATRLGKSQVEIFFGTDQNLQTSEGQSLLELEAAGSNDVFYPVSGELKDNRIIILNKNDQVIKQVRYAWRPFSRGNLINRYGLPASTFSLIVNK